LALRLPLRLLLLVLLLLLLLTLPATATAAAASGIHCCSRRLHMCAAAGPCVIKQRHDTLDV
jgi:hypothetical protein